MSKKLISIVIPVKNGEQWIGRCLDAILRQSLFHLSEIIIIDSGSDDNSLEILKNYPIKLLSIPPIQFNHGQTRNLSLDVCEGEYIVMTVQDAVPADNYWLQKLLDGFALGSDVAGVCGQQIVDHDLLKNPIQWFRPRSVPEIESYQYKSHEFLHLSPEEKRFVCRWDNVTAMYRRDILLKIPFRTTSFAEDLQWAHDAIISGYKIVYNYAARVVHYHHEDYDYVFKRTFTVSYFQYSTFKYIPKVSPINIQMFFGWIKILLKEHKLSMLDKLKWLKYNIKISKAYNDSINEFRRSLEKDEKHLFQRHQTICKQTPVHQAVS